MYVADGETHRCRETSIIFLYGLHLRMLSYVMRNELNVWCLRCQVRNLCYKMISYYITYLLATMVQDFICSCPCCQCNCWCAILTESYSSDRQSDLYLCMALEVPPSHAYRPFLARALIHCPTRVHSILPVAVAVIIIPPSQVCLRLTKLVCYSWYLITCFALPFR